MPQKAKNVCPKNFCNGSKPCRRISNSTKGTRPVAKVVTPKKVVSSKSVHPVRSQDGKSCSTGLILNHSQPVVKPKKTTKSDLTFNKKNVGKDPFDCCKRCGDTVPQPADIVCKKSSETDKLSSLSIKDKNRSETMKKYINGKLQMNMNRKQSQSVQQYFKNENFRQISESSYSISNFKKIPVLDPIKELPEKRATEKIKLTEIFENLDSSEYSSTSDMDSENIDKIKEFRRSNYFECHSATNRVKNRGSATSLKDHKCVYRFYLNDRLFPMPLSTDHRGNIRCLECQLPLEYGDTEGFSQHINGTIQAKVKIGSNVTQDMILMLPVKEPLIIKERRKKLKPLETDVLYFGIVKLSPTGTSVFTQNLPSDSLALRYQKGYREYENNCEYEYFGDRGDIVII